MSQIYADLIGAICGIPLESSGHLTHLDHCHATGKLRSFLCTNCNRGLGHFQDDEELLEAARIYLIGHRANHNSPKEGSGL
jgi:hypothetical protein